jgi:predicted glycosyltransferase
MKVQFGNKARVLFCINTPAQAYTWRYIMEALRARGHETSILARDYGSTPELLTSFGFSFTTFKPFGRKFLRLMDIAVHLKNNFSASRGFKPSILVGFGADVAMVAYMMRKPSIIFLDNDPTRVQNEVTTWFADAIVTPDCFRMDLGKKHIRVKAYKEMAYLHPTYFKPDPSIITDLGLAPGERFAILRFNVFDAVHDIGRFGFTTADKYELVQELGKYVRVFISPEGGLPPGLERYQLPVDYNRIHHILYYADLLVTDTQTMATEAAILGSPVVRCNNFVGPGDAGNFIELENKYDLIYSFRSTQQAKEKAIQLIQQPGLKEIWNKKRDRLLGDKIDLTRFMSDFIEGFPESYQMQYIQRNMEITTKENPG